MIKDHIEMFNPTVSHYRREHAPSRRYLPSDVTIKIMFDDFRKQHPDIDLSYYTYRNIVNKENISFTKLGNEECATCEAFKIHSAENNHSKENLQELCEHCLKWGLHNDKKNKARQEYQKDGLLKEDGLVVFSGDLQKVIMLPRLNMFKEVIFTPRLIAFNESFVPVGKNNKGLKPHAVIWHEAISGRGKDDIISAMYKFLKTNRDFRKILLWLDNCAAQNKNWALFTFFVYVINSDIISTDIIELKYFQPGHTFMSADSFHHQVELSLKRAQKVYDFDDFKNCVQAANSSKTVLCEMNVNDFYFWKDLSSQMKLKKTNPRPYLNGITNVKFERGKYTFQYKRNFDEAFIELNFLKANAQRFFPPGSPKQTPRGIAQERKNTILTKLTQLMPENRQHFWSNLPVSVSCTLEDSD